MCKKHAPKPDWWKPWITGLDRKNKPKITAGDTPGAGERDSCIPQPYLVSKLESSDSSAQAGHAHQVTTIRVLGEVADVNQFQAMLEAFLADEGKSNTLQM